MNLICIVLANILDQDYCQKFFTAKNYSENSDYIFSWSDRGFKDFLKSINTNESKIKIVGYPFKIQDKKLNKNKPYDKVLILHSPLPSKKAEKFDNIKYIQIIEHLDKLKLNVSFKAHPRIGFKKIHNLINYKIFWNWTKFNYIRAFIVIREPL